MSTISPTSTKRTIVSRPKSLKGSQRMTLKILVLAWVYAFCPAILFVLCPGIFYVILVHSRKQTKTLLHMMN